MTDMLQEQLKELLADQLGYPLDVAKIREDTSLYGKGMGLDSVDVISFVVRLEEKFEIFFEAEEVVPSMATFGALVQTVYQKLLQKEV
jgi:acyl carrier protein